MPFVSINPTDGTRISTHRGHTPAEIDSRLDAATLAFTAWNQFTPARRATLLRRLGRTLRAQFAPLAALITAEMGKPLGEARAEIAKCADCCEFYAKHAAAFLRSERPPAGPAAARIHHRPLGVILAIMPWNFPFWQVFRAAMPALAAGNTLVVKHASNVTGCAVAIEQLALDAGLPAGALTTLVIDGRAAGRLIADPRVRGVTLTGSTAAGRKIGALAGQHLKPCVLELGGSDPYIILEDADLDHAAETCAAARLLNNGQSCIAAKRFIVPRSILAAFEEKLTARMAARTVGNPAAEGTDQGPLARADLRDELHAQVVASRRRGARLLLGGKLPRGAGFYYPPTVLTDVAPGAPAHDEELFGPVAAIIPVPDEAAAWAAANATPYGLGSAVFARDPLHAANLARRLLDTGMIFINEAVRSHVAVPFGGVKASGLGRELGVAGVRAFTNPTLLWSAPSGSPALA